MKFIFLIILIFSLSLNLKLSELNVNLSDESSLFCTTWSTSNFKTLKKNLPPITLSNNSIRQIVRVSIGGTQIRIKFSNIVGTSILKIQKAIISDVKSQGSSEINIDTTKTITF